MSADKPERYEKDEQRFYPVEELGRDLVSVTTITGIIDKPALVKWSARMAVEFIQQRVLEELERGKISIKDLRGADVRDLVEQAKSYHDELKAAAGDRGTRVHAFVDQFVSGILDPNPFCPGPPTIDVDEDIAEQVNRFLVWWAAHDVKPKFSEKKVWSKEGGGYAGTMDDYWQVDGKWYVVDVKTSKGLWPEHKLQIAAYVFAFYERFPNEPVDGAAFLHISELTGEAEFVPLTIGELKILYLKFLCLAFYVNIELEAKAAAPAKPRGRPKKKPAADQDERADMAGQVLNETIDELTGDSVNGPVEKLEWEDL